MSDRVPRVAVGIVGGAQRVAELLDRAEALLLVDVGLHDAVDRRLEIAEVDEDVAGDALYTVAMYLGVMMLAPRARPWLLATLALGPIVEWYPYPFLNVATIGLGQTLLNCLVVTIVFVGLAYAAVWADGHLPRSSSRRA